MSRSAISALTRQHYEALETENAELARCKERIRQGAAEGASGMAREALAGYYDPATQLRRICKRECESIRPALWFGTIAFENFDGGTHVVTCYCGHTFCTTDGNFDRLTDKTPSDTYHDAHKSWIRWMDEHRFCDFKTERIVPPKVAKVMSNGAINNRMKFSQIAMPGMFMPYTKEAPIVSRVQSRNSNTGHWEIVVSIKCVEAVLYADGSGKGTTVAYAEEEACRQALAALLDKYVMPQAEQSGEDLTDQQ